MPKPKMFKVEDRIRWHGVPVGLSAAWGLKEIPGLLIQRMRPDKRPVDPADYPGAPNWRILVDSAWDTLGRPNPCADAWDLKLRFGDQLFRSRREAYQAIQFHLITSGKDGTAAQILDGSLRPDYWDWLASKSCIKP